MSTEFEGATFLGRATRSGERGVDGQQLVHATPPSPDPIDMGWASAAPDAAEAGIEPYKDDKRFFTLYQPLPIDRRLYLRTLEGTEQLGTPFEFDLLTVSRSFLNELKELNSQRLTIGIAQTDGSERYLDGFVTRFAFVSTDAGWSQYRATLSPWTHFLSLRQTSRIFQRLSIPQIVDQVFGEYGPVADYAWKLNRSYDPKDFIVQYEESDFAFVSRLLEREGLTYYYKWRRGGHTMVITDDTPDRGFCPPLDVYPEIIYNAGSRAMRLNAVTDLQAVRTLHPAAVRYDTFDYQAPHGLRAADIPTKVDQGQVPRLEVYTGTPGYAYRNRSAGERYATDEMEGIEARGKYFHGRTDCPDFTIGRTFALLEHEWFREPEPHRMLLLRVSHHGRNNIAPGETAEYAADFVCQRRFIPHRPERSTPKPVIAGLQTAIVTGPPGEEIWTNRNGCVKVRFHWDRHAPRDDRSSCWIRVASPWAGDNWGIVGLPRVGNEVLVGFMEGDPDRPIVVASVFNADQPHPWKLPDHKTQTGILSRSTTGGRYSHANAIRFEDLKGREQLWLHAEKDQLTEVEHDEDKWVGNDRRKTIDRDETVHVKRHRTETVDVDESITVHGQRTERVDRNETVSIGGNRTRHVEKNQKDKIGKNWSINVARFKTETIGMAYLQNVGLGRMENVGLGYSLNVGAGMSTTVGMMQTEQVGQSKRITVGTTFGAKVGQSYTLDVGGGGGGGGGGGAADGPGSVTENIVAPSGGGVSGGTAQGGSSIKMDGESIVFAVGEATLTLKADGTITVKGKDITVQGSGDVVCKADNNITIRGTQTDVN